MSEARDAAWIDGYFACLLACATSTREELKCAADPPVSRLGTMVRFTAINHWRQRKYTEFAVRHGSDDPIQVTSSGH